MLALPQPSSSIAEFRLTDCRMPVVRALMALILCCAPCVIKPASAAELAANVDAPRINGADQDPANWITYGRTYSEQRFSPLAGITADNVKQLGLAWYADLDTNRGQEATPLVIDGVMYVSTAWSMVKAFDAKSGALLWSYDPAVPRALGVRGCCDVVNRGVAAWKGKIYVGTFDGRLVALDARTGRQIWSVMTVDPDKPYTITQAPRVIKGRVVIGNSGAEYGVRGYISAYDAETGTLAWRFYTVPGDPASPPEQPISPKPPRPGMASGGRLAAGERCGKASHTTPSSTSSISASATGSNGTRAIAAQVRATIGSCRRSSRSTPIPADYVWHYQCTPGEEWDYDAVQQLILENSRSREPLAKS